MDLTLYINPIEIPSAQRKGISRTGVVYTKGSIRKAHQRITKLLIMLADGQRVNAEAYKVEITYVYRNKTLKKSEYGQPRVKRPDLDNITKLLQDAITDAQIAWNDDCSISDIRMRKRNAKADEQAHVFISIEADE